MQYHPAAATTAAKTQAKPVPDKLHIGPHPTSAETPVISVADGAELVDRACQFIGPSARSTRDTISL